MTNFKNFTLAELLKEWNECEELWSRYSNDSLGYYMSNLHTEIVNRGGWKIKSNIENSLT